MQKIITLLLILLVIGCSSNSNNNNNSNNGEPYRQAITQTYPNGQTKILEKYSKVHGVETVVERMTYNKDGRLVQIENPIANTQKKIIWYRIGKKRSETFFLKGKKHGPCTEWYSKGAIKEKKVYYQDQLVHQTQYSTVITSERFYTNGQLHISREYKQGTLWIETIFSSAKLFKKSFFYPDGQKSDLREYKDGALHGRCVYWDRNGEKRSETIYQNGIPVAKNE